jgi:hypothetical protein
MKPIIMITLMLLSAGSYAQDSIFITNRASTHIPTHPNATYQNNSQFYNKDNQIDMNKTIGSSNGIYIQPGYSNNVNRGANSNPLGREQNPANNAAIVIPTVIPVNITKERR